MKKALLDAAKKADESFYGSGAFVEKCKYAMQLLKDMSNNWVKEGIVR